MLKQIDPLLNHLEVDVPIRVQAALTYKGMIQVEQDPHIGKQITQASEDLWHLDFQCPPSERMVYKVFLFIGIASGVLEPTYIRERMCEKMNDERDKLVLLH